MLHEWTLKTLHYVKEVRQKQPHVIWFYLNKIFRIYFILLLFGTVCKNHYFLKIWFLKYPLKSTVPKIFLDIYLELPGWCSGQESAYQCRRHGSIPGLGEIPCRWKWYPLQHSCLENPMDGGAWGYSPSGNKESDTTGHTQQQQQTFTSLFQFSNAH